MGISSAERFAELKELRALPSPSGVALEIMRLTKNEDTSLAQIVHAVRADPALSGRLIQLANAAAQGGARPVVALQDVVARLGLVTVKQTALGFSLISEHRGGTCAGFEFDAFWTRSLAMGVAAQFLARHVKAAPPEECFALGLLSNIGALALASVYPEAYGKLLSSGDRNKAERLDAERAAFAMDHSEIGASMLDDWGFPSVFSNACLSFGNPQRFPPTQGTRTATIADLLALASEIADICVMDAAGRSLQLSSMHRCAATLAVGAEDLSTLLPAIVTAWQEWGAVLKVPTKAVPSLAELEQARKEAPALAVGACQRSAALRVLIVDDDRSTLELMSSILKDGGHVVRTARNGDDALQEVLRDPPQIVITDWEMPVMDGLAFCKALRASEIGRNIYLVIVTGHGNEERLSEAFAAGADDYISKPLRPRELEARLLAGRRFIEIHQVSLKDSVELRAIANELVVANRRLKYLARTDELTGLPNRRYAMERLEQEFMAAARKGSPLGLMMADVDQFKKINDTHGHQQGDAVLRAIAKVLRGCGRTEDTVCRVGGEEFMVIVPRTDKEGLLTLSERLRAAIAAQKVPGESTDIAMTISIGVSILLPGSGSTRELIGRCDQALYRAKREGRNRVVMAP